MQVKNNLDKTYFLWKKFIETGTIDNSSNLPSYIKDSWQRCRGNQVDPYIKRTPIVLKRKDLIDLLNKNNDLIIQSRPFLQNLYSFLDDEEFIVSLFDSDGFILDIIGHGTILESIKKVDFIVGALWSEKTVGTSAIGTSLYDKNPRQVIASQHYYRHGHRITGSGAPIYDSDENTIGGLTIFGPAEKANPHTLGMVVSAAHAITYYMQTIKQHIKIELSNNLRKVVLENITEALIVINSENLIWLTNDNAHRMLQLPPNCLGKHLLDAFGIGNEGLIKSIINGPLMIDEEVKIILHNNRTSYYTVTTTKAFCSEHKDIGKVIIINEFSRAKKLATKMIGAKAKLHFKDIIGQHPLFIETVNIGKKAAENSLNVLLLGESGTGKNIFAQSIHNESDRSSGPFVSVNCAAIPRELIASELFGYTEGSFTGSKKGGNPGKFELADGGTICLDEIGEMPLELQTSLLSVLEERSIVRVGGREVIPVDVRVIATTNRNLLDAISKGVFREDLYYRLNVIQIDMVPLRNRKSDIIILINHFINMINNKRTINNIKINQDVWNILINYPWPGNVRQLQNVLERASINITASGEITTDSLPKDFLYNSSVNRNQDILKTEIKPELIVDMLKNDISKSKIASKLKISRSTFYRKLKRYGIPLNNVHPEDC